MQCSSRISALRRGLNSHEAAKPQTASDPPQQTRHQTRFERVRKERHGSRTAQQEQEPVMNSGNKKNDKHQDMELWFHIPTHRGSETLNFSQFIGPSQVALARVPSSTRGGLNTFARQGLPRGAGGPWGEPRGVTMPGHAKHQCTPRTALPNPSFKRTPNSVAHQPASAGPAAHFALAVRRATLPGSA